MTMNNIHSFDHQVNVNKLHLNGYTAPTIPFNDETRPVDLWGNFEPPPLPRNLLPRVIDDFAFGLSQHMGADPAGLAMAALTVCAAAIPDTIQVQVKRHDASWCESARIWTMLVGPPSTKKSPIISAASGYLRKIDLMLVRDWQTRWARWNTLDKVEKATTPEPVQTRKLIEDTTVEALQEALRGSTEGVLCLRDELSGWFGSMEKYGGGGKASSTDRAIWLQAFNGGSYSINRIGRGTTVVPNLSVSLLGGVQPDAIRKLAADAVDDGLLQRMFPIVLRPATVGDDVPMPPTQAVYDFTVMMLGGMRPGSRALQFDDDAQAVRRQLENRHNWLMTAEVLNPKLASHVGKLDGLWARLCVLWHAIEHANVSQPPGVITASTAGRVAEFMRIFLLPQATAFYGGILGLSDDHERLKAVAAHVIAHRLTEITVRDVQRGDRAMRKIAKADVLPILEQLTALNWLSEVPGPRASSDPTYLVNPAVHTLFAERAAREKAKRDSAKRALDEMFGQ